MTETYAAIRHTFASTFYVDDELTPTVPLCPDQLQPLPSTVGAAEAGSGSTPSYLGAISALARLRFQVLADMSAGAEATVSSLLVDLPDITL